MSQGLGPRATVSCVLLTDRLTAESAGWFTAVREIVDELVIYVDTQHAGEETHAFAHKLTSQVHEVKGMVAWNGIWNRWCEHVLVNGSSDWIATKS